MNYRDRLRRIERTPRPRRIDPVADVADTAATLLAYVESIGVEIQDRRGALAAARDEVRQAHATGAQPDFGRILEFAALPDALDNGTEEGAS